jgi:hypothetical protein
LLAVVAVAELPQVNTAAAVAALVATSTQHQRPSRQLGPASASLSAQVAAAALAVLAATTEAAAPSRRSLCPQRAVGVAGAETDLPSPETAAEAAAALVVSLETPQAQVLLDKETTVVPTAPKAFHSVAAAVVVVAASE